MKRLTVVLVAVFVLLIASVGPALADPGLPLLRMPIAGDQDGSEAPLEFNAPAFSLLRDVQTFRVPGEGSRLVTMDFVYREAIFSNEFGFFRADDASGRIDDLAPGDPGYVRAATDRATVVFPAGSTASAPDFSTSLTGGDVLVFFLVVNGTVDSLRLNNPDNLSSGGPVAFFSIDRLNPDGVDHFVGFRNATAGLTQFGFEDLYGGGDLDYDDIVYNLTETLQPSPTIERRDVVFIRGYNSAGACDGANAWVPEYMRANAGKAMFRNIQLGRVLHFNYKDGESYDCPRQELAYTGADTCTGVVNASVALRSLITRQTSGRISIVAHSMGGMVAAHMIALDPAWAKQHIASVITFDSPLHGVNDWATWSFQAVSPCTPIKGNPDTSLQDLMESSAVVQRLQSAAQAVPFYHFDATAQPDNTFFPRSHVRLDGARPFTLASWCGVLAKEPNCTPPEPMLDTHGTLWENRLSQQDPDEPERGQRDKAPLVACALAGAVDCTTVRPVIGPAAPFSLAAAPQSQVQMPALVGRAQFAVTFSTPVRMRLTAPDGTVYGPDGAGEIAGYAVDLSSEVYQITEPLSGTWTIDLLGTPEAIAGAGLGFSVLELAPPPTPLDPLAAAGGPYRGRIGEPVAFDATGSYDPDGQVVEFAWDFDGDGRFEAAGASPQTSYSYEQSYFGEVTLRVTDSQGRIATATAAVKVGSLVHLPLLQR